MRSSAKEQAARSESGALEGWRLDGDDSADWGDWSALAVESWEDGSALPRLLEMWCRHHRAEGAAVYTEDGSGELWQRQGRTGSGSFPVRLEVRPEGLELPGGLTLLSSPQGLAVRHRRRGALEYLLTAGARVQRLHERLKAQSFQENYKVVKLEALYDVGLAIASTLDLEELYEEVLLRAVSLLDARRGALYLLQEDGYRLHRTIGGDAQETLPAADTDVERFLATEAEGDDEVLPGATYRLAVPITLEREARGLLVVADKESRHGVGPFLEEDRRALSMFASQAAIALENAALHLQALDKERLERELELAAEIQGDILPTSLPRLRDVELFGWNRPTQQVGGDYYGFLDLDAGRLGVVVADVTGKGMPAALLVSTLHSALRLLLDHVALGADLVSRLNDHICESTSSNKFITMIMLEVAEAGGAIGYVNAGHNPGILLRREGGVVPLTPSGLPLGLLRDSSYRFERLDLHPGDLICLYSDGITECTSTTDEEFGQERLVDFLQRRMELPLDQLLRQLDDEVSAFAGSMPQGDDQTVVLLRRKC